MPFPAHIEAALRQYDQNKGIRRRLSQDSPPIARMRDLPDRDRSSLSKLISCFMANPPMPYQASYAVFASLLLGYELTSTRSFPVSSRALSFIPVPFLTHPKMRSFFIPISSHELQLCDKKNKILTFLDQNGLLSLGARSTEAEISASDKMIASIVKSSNDDLFEMLTIAKAQQISLTQPLVMILAKLPITGERGFGFPSFVIYQLEEILKSTEGSSSELHDFIDSYHYACWPVRYRGDIEQMPLEVNLILSSWEASFLFLNNLSSVINRASRRAININFLIKLMSQYPACINLLFQLMAANNRNRLIDFVGILAELEQYSDSIDLETITNIYKFTENNRYIWGSTEIFSLWSYLNRPNLSLPKEFFKIIFKSLSLKHIDKLIDLIITLNFHYEIKDVDVTLLKFITQMPFENIKLLDRLLRDIKQRNILLSKGVVKLLIADFHASQSLPPVSLFDELNKHNINLLEADLIEKVLEYDSFSDIERGLRKLSEETVYCNDELFLSILDKATSMNEYPALFGYKFNPLVLTFLELKKLLDPILQLTIKQMIHFFDITDPATFLDNIKKLCSEFFSDRDVNAKILNIIFNHARPDMFLMILLEACDVTVSDILLDAHIAWELARSLDAAYLKNCYLESEKDRFEKIIKPTLRLKYPQKTNEDVLAEINFPETNVPQKYCCAISYAIMTDPVYDIKTPQIFFERINILRWLKNSRTNPYTCLPLTKQDLKPAQLLQYDIESFVSEQLAKNKKQPAMRLWSSSPVNFNMLFQKMSKNDFINNRHQSSQHQHEYDKRYGLVVASN